MIYLLMLMCSLFKHVTPTYFSEQDVQMSAGYLWSIKTDRQENFIQRGLLCVNKTKQNSSLYHIRTDNDIFEREKVKFEIFARETVSEHVTWKLSTHLFFGVHSMVLRKLTFEGQHISASHYESPFSVPDLHALFSLICSCLNSAGVAGIFLLYLIFTVYFICIKLWI